MQSCPDDGIVHIRMEEVPGGHGCRGTPAVTMTTAGDDPGDPDVVTAAGTPCILMLLSHGHSCRENATAVARGLRHGHSAVLSGGRLGLGGVGNRVYTGIADVSSIVIAAKTCRSGPSS